MVWGRKTRQGRVSINEVGCLNLLVALFYILFFPSRCLTFGYVAVAAAVLFGVGSSKAWWIDGGLMGIGKDMPRRNRRQGCILDWTSEDLEEQDPFFSFCFLFLSGSSPPHITYLQHASRY